MKRKYVPILILLPLLLCACAGQSGPAGHIDTAYKTLKSAAIVYDDALSAAAELHALGLIGEADKARVIAAGDIYRTAWTAAVGALHAYAAAYDADPATADRSELLARLALAESAYAELMKIARPYLIQAMNAKEAR